MVNFFKNGGGYIDDPIECGKAGYASVFFLMYTLTVTFIVLNLFIAIIVDSLQAKHFDDEEARDAEADADRDLLHSEVSALRQEIAELKALVQRSVSGSSSTSVKADDKSE